MAFIAEEGVKGGGVGGLLYCAFGVIANPLVLWRFKAPTGSLF